jgi:hypothetical protein
LRVFGKYLPYFPKLPSFIGKIMYIFPVTLKNS